MQQLISIETVPISIEYTTARLETKSKSASGNVSSSARLNISKNDNQLTIRSNPIVIQFHERFRQNAGQNMSYSATAEYSNNILSMDVKIHSDGGARDVPSVNPMRFQAAGSTIDRMVDAVPKSASSESPLHMKISFNMTETPESQQIAAGAEASFIPPDIQMDIVEYPKVIIKYIGGPIYFPRSSDPNYEPPVNDVAFEAKV